MEESNKRVLLQLLRLDGNNVCAECNSEDPEWASYTIGIFLCTSCAGFHRNLGSHISRVKSLRLDKWDIKQLQEMINVGNLKSRAMYEVHVPPCYRRPFPDDAFVYKEQWVQAKYERKEFIYKEKQHYLSGKKEGWLWKKAKDSAQFLPRKFILEESTNTLKYLKQQTKEYKAVIRLSELNANFCPQKIGHLNGIQLTFLKDGTTRNIFLYSQDGKDIVHWYIAIRSAKLNHLLVAFPSGNHMGLLNNLTRIYEKESWLWKKGPRATDTYKHRWFTLDNRNLMYLEDPLDAYPKGEIFLGYHTEGYSIVPCKSDDVRFVFSLCTPMRKYELRAETEEDYNQWLIILQHVINRPLTPQENSSKFLIKRRH